MIRRAQPADVAQLLVLMRKLAEFEGSSNRFCVTELALTERGFAVDRSTEFIAWLAEDSHAPVGYAIAYIIPFTFDLRPTVVLKELFIDEPARGKRYGSQLFAPVIQFARTIDARLVRFQVLPDNQAAKRFYRVRGGNCEGEWEHWVLDLESVR